jgi:cell division protein FtsI (penicillin-binding protein 3)
VSLLRFQTRRFVEQKTVREHPIGKIPREQLATKDKTVTVLIIEWAYKKYLNGKDGKILKQKIAKDSGNPLEILTSGSSRRV